MRTVLAAFVLLLGSAAVCAADGNARNAVGTVSATVEFSTGFATPLTVDAALLDSLPDARIEANDHGVAGVWDGVPLIELLRKAGAPLGDTLRGPNLGKYVVITAIDGYRVVFTLAELDPAFGDETVALVFARDGAPLSEKEGPYRIVVPGDDKQARWIRQVTKVELFDAPGTPARKHEH